MHTLTTAAARTPLALIRLALGRFCAVWAVSAFVALALLAAPPSAQANPAAPSAKAARASAGAEAATAPALPLPADMARIRQRGELVVAVLATDSPPFFYTRGGELVGLEIDLARAIAQELKVGIRFNREAQSFNEVIDLVAQRRVDLGISKLSRTLQRAQVVHFSQPYLTLNHALVLNRVAFARLAPNKRLEDTIRHYSGTLGVIAGSSFVDFAKRDFPKAQVKEYATWPGVMAAMQRGDVIAAYRDEFEIKRMLKADPTAALTLRTITLKDVEDTLGVAVGVTDPTLLAFVNQMLGQRRDKLDIHKVLSALEDR